jgi:oligopeptide transport system substrate-binding protein
MRRSVPLALALLCSCEASAYFGTTRPRHGKDELWINNMSEPQYVDPGKCADAVGGEIIFNTFAGLTQPHPQTLEPVPDVAHRWERSADGKTFTFHLRPTRWSDGRPVTADDYAWSWRRVLDPATASQYASFLYVLANGAAFNQGALHVTGLPESATAETVRALFEKLAPIDKIEKALNLPGWFVFLGGDPASRDALRATLLHPAKSGTRTTFRSEKSYVSPILLSPILQVRVADESVVGVRAVDDATLRVELAAPVPYFLHMVSFYTAMPVPRHVIDRLLAEGKNPDLWTRPEYMVTNGAYDISEWKFRQYLVLEKNPHYWDQARVRVPTIRLLEIDGHNAALNMYRAGELDWIGSNTSLPAEFMDHLRGYKDYEASPYLTIYWYWINTAKKPLDDVRVREALSLAIDREALVKYVKRSGEVPTADVVPDGLAGYDALGSPLFDAARAKELLVAAGFPGGQGFPKVTLSYNTSEGHKQIAETMQQMWKQNLGITVALENQEWKVFLDNLNRFEFDIGRLGWVGDYPDPYSFLEVFTAHNGNNKSQHKDAEYDRMLTQANELEDAEARLLLLQKAEARLMAARPVIPLYVYSRDHLKKPYVMGLWPNYLDRHPYKWMWIDERWYDGVPASSRADAPPDESAFE